jgi:hypothetical protein
MKSFYSLKNVNLCIPGYLPQIAQINKGLVKIEEYYPEIRLR